MPINAGDVTSIRQWAHVEEQASPARIGGFETSHKPDPRAGSGWGHSRSQEQTRRRDHPSTERVKKLLAFPLLLENYTMTYNHITALEELYRTRSRCGGGEEAEAAYSYGPVLSWPSESWFEKFKLDARLLKEALSPSAVPRDATLAEQVFGSQARQQKIGLGHLANVLYERALLHQRHLRDIDWRLVDCQDRLSVLKMHFPMDGGRPQQHLEKLILELEKERHEEEIGFWKDSAEIRQQLFENAATYGAAKRRQDMLYGVEVNGI
jgi:hypothetical protein